jgi:hypothetical protein
MQFPKTACGRIEYRQAKSAYGISQGLPEAVQCGNRRRAISAAKAGSGRSKMSNNAIEPADRRQTD